MIRNEPQPLPGFSRFALRLLPAAAFAVAAIFASTPALAVDGSWSLFPNAPLRTTPPHRHGHTMVFDATNQRLVVFGGFRSGLDIPLGDTWMAPMAATPVFDSLAISPGPGPRHGHASVYDPVRQRMLVFDGVTTPSAGLDTWALSLSGFPVWSSITATGAPATMRQGVAAVFDPVRDRVLLFGGYDGISFRNEVLVFTHGAPSSWSVLATTGTPPTGRNYAAMIYDPVRDRLIVFGGNTGVAENAVWELDLTASPAAWQELTPLAPLPVARLAASAIYDPVGDRMIVHGGIAAPDTRFGDVWALSLSGSPAWSDITPSSGPTPRHSEAAVYDPAHSRMLVYGGESFGSRNELWSLSLTGPPAWTLLGGAQTLPGIAPATHGAAFEYDPLRRRVLRTGGVLFLETLASLLELRLDINPEWRSLFQLGDRPRTLQGVSLTYDPTADRMILFGGYHVSAPGFFNNETRQLSLTGIPTWSLLPTTGAPSARNYHSAVIDPSRNRLVLFGGNESGTPKNDLWWLDLATLQWTEVVNPTAPSPRLAHRAVIDPANDRMVIYGGVGNGGEVGDVWSLDLASLAWTEIPLGGGPGPRHSVGMVFDALRQRALVHGGYDGSTSRSDIWELSLGAVPAWHALDVNPTCPARHGHGAIYDDIEDRLVVNAGFSKVLGGTLGDTWQWYPNDFPTPTLASLAHLEAEPGEVRATWYWADGNGRMAAVERGTAEGAWQTIATVPFESGGLLRFTDATVVAGARYGYRIAYDSDGVLQRTATAWVQVPTGLSLALGGFVPNPSPVEAFVSFTLPRTGDSRIEVLDVAGRRVADERFANLEAGSHRIRLGAGTLAPGVYVVRMTFGDRTLTARGAVIP